MVVIREVYDNDNAQEIFEVELEKAIQVNKVFNCGQLHLCTNFMIVISRNLLHGFEIHKHRALLKGSTGKKLYTGYFYIATVNKQRFVGQLVIFSEKVSNRLVFFFFFFFFFFFLKKPTTATAKLSNAD